MTSYRSIVFISLFLLFSSWSMSKDFPMVKEKLLIHLESCVESFQQKIKIDIKKSTTTLASNPEIQKILDNMVSISGGTFKMGSNKSSDEQPIHSVKVKSFKMSKYEVTQAQWTAVMGFNESYKGCDNCPIESVKWKEVQDFIKKLNQKTGRGFRLPSEAEWEYAARGGTQSKGYTYSGSNNLDEVAWHHHNSNNKTHAVGMKKANELGLYDMTGNVREWVQDSWNKNYEGAPSNGKAWVNERGNGRMVRGGCWDSHTIDSSVTWRVYYSLYNDNAFVGFRLAEGS